MVERKRRGPSYPAPPEWKQKVSDELRRRGLNKADLAELIGVSRAAVSDLLGKLEYSRLVPAVDKALWPQQRERIDRLKAELDERPANRSVLEIALKRAGPAPDVKMQVYLERLADVSELAVLNAILTILSSWVETDDAGRQQLLDLARDLTRAAERASSTRDVE